jgi:UDP-glucose 4-epimerase
MSEQIDWRKLHGTSFEGVRVIVTGGAGFIGSHLVDALLQLGAHVIVIDDLSSGHRENVPRDVELIAKSITDPSACGFADVKYVFHEAALASVPLSVEKPRAFHDVNITGTLNVLQAAAKAKVQRVMFAASSSAYGDSEILPKIETMAPEPMSPYAASKTAGEGLMRAWANCFGIDTVSLRYFNIFGPRQSPDSAYAAVIAAFAKAMLRGQNPMIFGDGEQSRDFTYVANAVHANLLAARHDKPLRGEVFNVACGKRVSLNQLASVMREALKRADLTATHQAPRTGDVRHSLADLTRIRETLGYAPVVDFEEGLVATLNWYAATVPAK